MLPPMSKTTFIMIIAALAAALGDAAMSRGMRQFGDVSALGVWNLWKVLGMFGNPMVLTGVACGGIFFFLYSSALSWSPLSATQPFNALNYLFTALLARFILGERVEPARWLGIALIVAGVIIIGRSQAAAGQ